MEQKPKITPFVINKDLCYMNDNSEGHKEYFKQKRVEAERQADIDEKKKLREILVEIHDESMASKEERDINETNVRTMFRFANLLYLINKKTETQTRIIIALTVILVFSEFENLYKAFSKLLDLTISLFMFLF